MPLDDPTWSTALPDWRKRLFAQETLIPPGMPETLDSTSNVHEQTGKCLLRKRGSG